MIPEGWKKNLLSELGEFANGINKGKEDFGFGVPFVNLQDIFGRNSIQYKPKGLVNATAEEINRYKLIKGDVLFIRSSVKPSGVGLTAVVINDFEDVIYSGFIIRFRQNEKTFSNEFLKYLFYE